MQNDILFFNFILQIKVNNFEHNRIVSRHKAFVSSTNVNCLISEEVQHFTKAACELIILTLKVSV